MVTDKSSSWFCKEPSPNVIEELLSKVRCLTEICENVLFIVVEGPVPVTVRYSTLILPRWEIAEKGAVRFLILLQPFNISLPNVVTEFGIYISVRETQLSKAFSPIDIRDFGNAMDVSDSHPKKAFLPIFVTPSGIIISFRSVQYAKRLS